jgi:3-phosphoshikimate 1-carboxyvinyltransferase
MYRLTALAAQRAGVAWDDEAGVARSPPGLDVEFGENSIPLPVKKSATPSALRKFPSAPRRSLRVAGGAQALLFRQRLFRQAPGSGRRRAGHGLGGFPRCAQTKVFLTASVEVRAERRYKQLIEKGIAASIQPLLLDLRERDLRDSQRSVAPLQQNEDAELLDTTESDHRPSRGSGLVVEQRSRQVSMQ